MTNLDMHDADAPRAVKMYLAGPMSGIPRFNIPAFEGATVLLRECGWEIVSPVEEDGEEIRNAAYASLEGMEIDLPADVTWGKMLARDVQIVADEVDGVIVLPGWQKSRGAQLEVYTARLCEKPVLAFDPLSYDGTRDLNASERDDPEDPETILAEAERLVHGDRGAQYGHPGDDFARTAGAWRALFDWDVAPIQVPMAMAVVKLSRLQQTPLKRDSWVDIAGYAETGWMVAQREEEESKVPDWAPEVEEMDRAVEEIREQLAREYDFEDLADIDEEAASKLRHDYLARAADDRREKDEEAEPANVRAQRIWSSDGDPA